MPSRETDVQELPPTVLDLDVVRAWMDQQHVGSGALSEVRTLTGGTQNVMVTLCRAGRRYVLRRPPVHPRTHSNDALRREIRVLGALRHTDVAHPRLIAACEDPAVLGGAVFYVMEAIEGFNPAEELPKMHSASASMRQRMAFNAVDALAQLGAVDYHELGLGDLGKVEGFLDRQVSRWSAELDSYTELAGYPSPSFDGVDGLLRWLDDHRPRRFTPALVHGDFHIANLMFSHTGPELAAIVDWEMCTVGDPLLDLGWLLATWPDSDGVAPGGPTPLWRAGDLPSATSLIERYTRQTGSDTSAIDWYVVLACFKLGVLLEGTYARSMAGQASRETGERLHRIAVALFHRATTIVAGE